MSSDTVCHVGTEYGYRFVEAALADSEEGQRLYSYLEEDGFQPMPERAHVFNIFSPESLQSVAVAIMPFVTGDQSREGGLSISEGGHAQAVTVRVEDRTKVVGFTHLALDDGKVRAEEFDIESLRGRRAADLAEEAGKIRAARPLVEVTQRQARSLASVAFNALLDDDLSRSVHKDEEIDALRANTGVLAEIATFVLLRTSGSSCCSCSCSCWGSSSCSSSYIKS